MPADKSSKSRSKGPGKLAQFYLLIYNTVQTIGWSYLFYQTVTYFTNREANLYDKVWLTVTIFQNLAILEVVHAFIRIVPSNPIITLIQISSRVMLVCGALMLTNAARVSIGFPLLLFAWSITEIIRYANYALNLINAVPYILVWLRYTTFYILYPIGVTGELLCLYNTYLETSENGMLTVSLPNKYNFAFSYPYFILAVMLSYIPLFPQMYIHMINQRKKVIGGGGGAATTTSKKAK